MATKKPRTRTTHAPEPQVEDQELITESAASESNSPARHHRAVPPARRHGVRQAAAPAAPKGGVFEQMLYDKKNRTFVAKSEEELDAKLATKKWFESPQGDFSSHRHVEGAIAPHLAD